MKSNSILRLLPLLVLCLVLAACGPEEPQDSTPDTQALTQSLLDTGAFSDSLDAVTLEQAELCQVYGLDPAGVESAVSYTDLNMGAEELTIFCMKNPEDVDGALDALTQHVAQQREALVSYQPEEVPKLDAARITHLGRCAVLAVSAEPELLNELLP